MHPRGEIIWLQERSVKGLANAYKSVDDGTLTRNWMAKMMRDDKGVVVNHIWYTCGRGGNTFSDWTEDFPFRIEF